MTKILVVYRGIRNANPYIGNIVDLLKENGYAVTEVAWDFQTKEQKQSVTTQQFPGHSIYTFNVSAKEGFKGLSKLPLFLSFLKKKIRQEKPDLFYSINEDIAYWVLSSLGKRNVKLIADIRDGVCERTTSTSTLIIKLLQHIRRKVLRQAALVIMPDAGRASLVSHFAEKVILFPNIPKAVINDPASLDEIPIDLSDEKEIRILLSGTLTIERGVQTLLDAVNMVTVPIRVIAIGWFNSDVVKELVINNPKFTYLGVLPNAQAIKIARKCNAVYCYYNPISTNNIYASPTKFYESISIGTPVLINSETKISGYIAEHKLGLSAPFHDPAALAHNLSMLTKSPATEKYLSDFFQKHFSWKATSDHFITSIKSIIQ